MVRIPRFHRGDRGSSPLLGKLGAAKNYATEQDVGDIKGNHRQDVHATWEHGNAYMPEWSKGSGECALPRIRWFESSCRQGEHGKIVNLQQFIKNIKTQNLPP